MSKPAELVWGGGGAARVVKLDGESIVIRSARAHAPGSRPSGVLGSGRELRIKTHRSRRDDSAGDGLTFTVEGRVLDLTRELREALVSALADGTNPDESVS